MNKSITFTDLLTPLGEFRLFLPSILHFDFFEFQIEFYNTFSIGTEGRFWFFKLLFMVVISTTSIFRGQIKVK